MLKKVLCSALFCLCSTALLFAQNQTGNEATKTPEKSVEYSLGFNAWIGSENDDLSGTPADGLVSHDSYNIQLSYKFASNQRNKWLPFESYTQMYVSFRALKFVSNIDDGYEEWAENMTATGLVYGNRYFLNQELKGFNFGWYAGAAYAQTEGESWTSGTNGPSFPYTEEYIIPLVAAELSYDLSVSYFFLEPTVSFYYNTSENDLEFFPSIIVGLQFK